MEEQEHFPASDITDVKVDVNEQVDQQNNADEVDINEAIPTQQRYNQEDTTLVQHKQIGPFTSIKARTYAISVALLFYCILAEWFWNRTVSDAILIIDTCNAFSPIGIDCSTKAKKIRMVDT